MQNKIVPCRVSNIEGFSAESHGWACVLGVEPIAIGSAQPAKNPTCRGYSERKKIYMFQFTPSRAANYLEVENTGAQTSAWKR